MKRERFSITFFVNPTRVANGKGILQCRITYRGKVKTFSTGNKLPVSHWQPKHQRFAGYTQEARKLNNKIDEIRAGLTQSRDELLKERTAFNVDDIISRFRGDVKHERFLLATYSEYIEKHKKPFVLKGNRSKTLLQKHNRTLQLLTEYVHLENGAVDLDIRLIDFAFISGFYTYLVTESNLSNNTAQKHMQRLREIYLFCFSNGWVLKDPFKQYKFRFEEVDRSFLTEPELKQLSLYHPPTDAMRLIKDLFMFCCYTGLSYSDLRDLKMSDVITENNKPAIKKKRHKTNIEFYVPLLPEARALLTKYQFCHERTFENKAFPVRSNQKCNINLKALLECASIEKPVSFHGARHTFATMMISNGVSMEALGKMIGHKNLKTTQKYGRVLMAMVDDEMQKLIQKRIDDQAA